MNKKWAVFVMAVVVTFVLLSVPFSVQIHNWVFKPNKVGACTQPDITPCPS